jgi:hypothetical protein
MNRRELLGAVGAVSLLPASEVFAATPPARVAPALEAALRIGPAQSGAGNHRWAQVVDGTVAGSVLQGVVQSGRLDWHVDPASGAVSATTRVQVLRSDGVLVELRDRTTHAGTDRLAALPGWSTAPELFEAASGRPVTAGPLTGRLDTADLGRGVVRLRAFDAA